MDSRHEKNFIAVADKLLELGFPPEFAAVVAEQTSTDYTCKRMLSYLKNAAPATLEEVADEMLIILEERDRFAEKAIEKKKYR